MMPAAKPSMASSAVRLAPRTQKTSPAPAAVTAQVKSVASSACQTWPSCENQSNIAYPTKAFCAIICRRGSRGHKNTAGRRPGGKFFQYRP